MTWQNSSDVLVLHSQTSQERELWTFANLNLAIVYVRTRRDADFMALLDRISPERLPSQSHSLQAAAYYIQGLQEFFAAKYNDAKWVFTVWRAPALWFSTTWHPYRRYLRETLKMANAEDLNRLTVCALVLLGHIFLSLGNSRESMNMVTPAMQLSSKIPDTHVQLWASAILKGTILKDLYYTWQLWYVMFPDLYRMANDPNREQEGLTMHKNFSQTLLQDHFRASQLSEHHLIDWTDGPFPALPLPSTASSSTAPAATTRTSTS